MNFTESQTLTENHNPNYMYSYNTNCVAVINDDMIVSGSMESSVLLEGGGGGTFRILNINPDDEINMFNTDGGFLSFESAKPNGDTSGLTQISLETGTDGACPTLTNLRLFLKGGNYLIIQDKFSKTS